MKYVIFCLVVAIAIFIGNQIAKYPPASGQQTNETPNVRFDVSLDRPPDSGVSRGPGKSDGHHVRFRLANQGNSPVYCPVVPGTNVLVGHVVHRASVQSDWVALPSADSITVADQSASDHDWAWIELPPGGWIDGQFYDPRQPNDDHAYAFDLKPGREAAIVQFISQPLRHHPE